LTAAAVECDISKFYIFSFIFDVPFMGRLTKRERNEVKISPKGLLSWVTSSAGMGGRQSI
jgi:hypothetical protein